VQQRFYILDKFIRQNVESLTFEGLNLDLPKIKQDREFRQFPIL